MDQGAAAGNAMTLIRNLEGLVREKNEIIAEWRRKYYVSLCFFNYSTWIFGFACGAGCTTGLYLLARWLERI